MYEEGFIWKKIKNIKVSFLLYNYLELYGFSLKILLLTLLLILTFVCAKDISLSNEVANTINNAFSENVTPDTYNNTFSENGTENDNGLSLYQIQNI